MNKESTQTLYLLDAYALIYRAYYAFISNPFKNSKGFNTSTVFGFVNTIDELIKNKKPDYIAIVFDPPEPTFRNEIFPEYKANRDKTPENIQESIPIIKEIIDAYNIPIFQISGFEADDVIGTLAKKAESSGIKIFMMTPDKDYAQLISENISIYKPKRAGNEAEIIGLEDVRNNFLVSDPIQLTDIFALWGDKSDNIPGVPGIGEKTAKNLIAEYQNIDILYENIDKISGKIKSNLINFKDQAYLSKELVTIKTDVPVNFKLKDLESKIPDIDKLISIFKELEFKSLIQKYSEKESNSLEKPVQGSLFDTNTHVISKIDFESEIDLSDKDYILIDNEAIINDLIKRIKSSGFICFDTETSSLNINEAELVGLSFSVKPDEAFYLPIEANFEKAVKTLKNFKDIFENKDFLKIGHNLKFDIRVLNKYHIDVKGPLFDTMVAHYLLHPEQRHNLNGLAAAYLNYTALKIEELIGAKGKSQGNMRDVPIDKIKNYACSDADITLQLYRIFYRDLKENDLYDLAVNLEMPLVKVLADIENNGVNIDKETLAEFAEHLNKEIDSVEKGIFNLAGTEFNISSPKQLGDILFKKLKIDSGAKLTRTKQFSTSEETLSKLIDKHQIISEVLNFRTLKKLLNTYVEALPKLIDPVTGKIHTSFNQTITSTGRLSSNNPNLQNIPVRDERGKEIRKAFIPSSENFVLLSADYSQIELRLMAHLSEDENMIKAFFDKEDIHKATAAKIHNIEPEEVTREMRNQAKTANFGIIYGISSFGLSQRLNISRSDAKNLIDGYFRSYPGVKKYMEKSVKTARDIGYVTTIMGRKRYLPEINSRNAMIRGMAERNAINSPIQGSAADIIKLAMINISNEFKNHKLESQMILQVHDELIFNVKSSELTIVKEIVKNKMETAVKLNVPLIVEMGSGSNWLDAH